ncbi:hypothetical protein JC795_15600 [Pseudomonas veronii]|uniref:hypothetical protein n=1 Tax=Pseudomonas veronii TaxID=76761 RepID=UPI0018E7A6FF|nr:hypothetical protein [Pseudomonas veronii]MBJ2179620.1 hypothetical protein [Pseudomonas veronii]
MEERFKVMSFVHAVHGTVRYRVTDTADHGNPANNRTYDSQSLAEAARDLAYDNELHLPEGWNRSLLRLQNELSIDSNGKEIFVGLDRDESEEYVSLVSLEPTDRFIDLERKHKIALTGITDL